MEDTCRGQGINFESTPVKSYGVKTTSPQFKRYLIFMQKRCLTALRNTVRIRSVGWKVLQYRNRGIIPLRLAYVSEQCGIHGLQRCRSYSPSKNGHLSRASCVGIYLDIFFIYLSKTTLLRFRTSSASNCGEIQPSVSVPR